MAGKGSTPRRVNRKKYSLNYERIFGTESERKKRRNKIKKKDS